MRVHAWNNKEVKTCSDKARQAFIDAGLDYGILWYSSLNILLRRVNDCLKKHGEDHPDFQMHARQWKIVEGSGGRIKSAFLEVDGPYFEKREAISFNSDGWIGFAGWACTENAEPFTNAFLLWVKECASSD